MKYKEYIDLGFERIDISDNIEFDESGYYGFILSKKIKKNVFIEVVSGELDSPKLYIKKKGSIDQRILPLTEEMIKKLLK